MDRRRFLALLGGAAMAAGCRARPGAGQPRLALLYATCSLDAGHLAPYRPEVAFTPAVARFARQAAVLQRHQTEAGQSGVAYASLFSGVQADRHGVFDHPRVLAEDLTLLTERFAAAGWEVYFWGGHGMASYDLGYGQGVPVAHHRPQWLTADDPLFAEVVDRVGRDPSFRALVVTNFTVTHMRYTANPAYFDDGWRSPRTLPEEFARTGLDADEFRALRRLFLEEATDFQLCGDLDGTLRGWGLDEEEGRRFRAAVEYLYRCAVARLDAAFGGVAGRLEQAGVLDDAVVVFTADHGETLTRPGTFLKYAHGFQLAPEVLRVPMLVRAPAAGVEPGAFQPVTRSIDVTPTLAGLCGLPPDGAGTTEGVDLAPVLRGEVPPPNLRALSHTSLVPEAVVRAPAFRGSILERLHPTREPESLWVALRDGDVVAKMARRRADGPIEPAVYNLGADPMERLNLFRPGDPAHQRLLADLEAYKARLVAAHRALQRGQRRELPESERLERLRALGYVS